MSEPLKVCPFCGGEATLKIKGNLASFVCEEGSTCRGSGLATCALVSDLETAITAWNTRPREAELEAEVGRLREAAREGLVCAEADLAERREQCLDHGEDPDADQFYHVFKERRDLIASALSYPKGAEE